jgi:D-glycero-beta-D-manno-heptose 1-phosphate adenylyltransferase
MKSADVAMDKIFSRPALQEWTRKCKELGKKIVFTNGCFDILHQGHMDLLSYSSKLGDVLVLGVNSDKSVKKLKGKDRPVNHESFRAFMLASLSIVDAVCIFEEDTPLELIKAIEPDCIVKGGDYRPDQVVGAEQVISTGGEVKIFPLVKGYSTSALIDKIQKL